MIIFYGTYYGGINSYTYYARAQNTNIALAALEKKQILTSQFNTYVKVNSRQHQQSIFCYTDQKKTTKHRQSVTVKTVYLFTIY